MQLQGKSYLNRVCLYFFFLQNLKLKQDVFSPKSKESKIIVLPVVAWQVSVALKK